MDDASIHCILDYIAREWHASRQDRFADHQGEKWPYGAWICLHEPLPVGMDEVNIQINVPWSAARFLDSDGVRRMEPAAFLRFWTVQIQRPWATGAATFPYQVDFTRPRNRIGVAAFAPFDGTDEIYLEAIWGGLWAPGQRVDLRGGGVHIGGTLWIHLALGSDGPV
ncbi:MAG TPA: hypothetical protein VGP82_01270 [Ktedonobacterales bacterium]|nr:hypothetical protein [Ktedonobacterales bacterium]